MSQPLRPDLEAKAQELATRIRSRSEASILEMARKLVATRDDTLFGDTEFALRDQALSLVADAYAEYLPQKVATSARPSNAPTVDTPPASTSTVTKRSRASAGRSAAGEPTTTAARVVKDPAPGTAASD